MSREQIIKIGTVVLVVVLLCAVIITSTGLFGSGVGGYANAEKYTSGDTEIRDEVKNIDVNWTSGRVKVLCGSGNTVKLEESSGRALSEDEKMQWWMDGDTLRVQFSKPGLRLNMPEKELTLTLPEGMNADQTGIHTTSGEIEFKGPKTRVLVLDSTSGNIRADAEATYAEINATSGDQKIRVTGDADTLRLNSTSGNIVIEAEKAKIIEIGSTSGGIGIQAEECPETKANSTSGDITIDLKKMERLSIGATSGSVTAKLPEKPGFTAKVSTTSGSFSYGIALTREGEKYVCGDGSGTVEIGTTAGNVRIDAAETAAE